MAALIVLCQPVTARAGQWIVDKNAANPQRHFSNVLEGLRNQGPGGESYSIQPGDTLRVVWPDSIADPYYRNHILWDPENQVGQQVWNGRFHIIGEVDTTKAALDERTPVLAYDGSSIFTPIIDIRGPVDSSSTIENFFMTPEGAPGVGVIVVGNGSLSLRNINGWVIDSDIAAIAVNGSGSRVKIEGGSLGMYPVGGTGRTFGVRADNDTEVDIQGVTFDPAGTTFTSRISPKMRAFVRKQPGCEQAPAIDEVYDIGSDDDAVIRASGNTHLTPASSSSSIARSVHTYYLAAANGTVDLVFDATTLASTHPEEYATMSSLIDARVWDDVYTYDSPLFLDGADSHGLGSRVNWWDSLGWPWPTPIEDPAVAGPGTLLAPNVPNPFNPATTFTYFVPVPGNAGLRIYDVSGRLVNVLVEDQYHLPGHYSVTWNARDSADMPVSSGTYFVRYHTDGETAVRKAVLLK